MTRVEIQAKINELTRQRNNYDQEKRNYNNSLMIAKKMLSSLNSSHNYLSISEENMQKYFTVNGKTADKGKIREVREEINKITKKINGTIIPDINNNISRLTNQINSLDRQINELRRQYSQAES